jgi:hypothetical protein
MTDALNRKADVQRILDYAESVAKESRKALTAEFNQQHKGMPFNQASKKLQDSLLSWFVKRDKNLVITYERTNSSKPGEVRAVFVGETKKVRFKLHVDAVFSVAGEGFEAPAYLKELNVTVDRRAFTN